MADNEDNNTGLQASLYDLADELGHLVFREHQILQGEMKQLRSLVSDAVKKLDTNFRTVTTNVSEQVDILGKAFDDGHVDKGQKLKFTRICEQINTQTATAIRVLQFDDIVQQLAGHACNRIARMQELFNELETMLDKIKSQGTGGHHEIVEHIHMMQSEISHFRARLEKENPVKQHSMDEGKIELF